LVSANYLLRRIAELFNEKDGTDDGKRMASNWEVILVSANYLLRRIAALFNEKDGTDDGKRMASNWEVILTPFLNANNIPQNPFTRRSAQPVGGP